MINLLALMIELLALTGAVVGLSLEFGWKVGVSVGLLACFLKQS
jgi:hypothetical protein